MDDFIKNTMDASEWNEQFPVGSKVVFLSSEGWKQARTISKAFTLQERDYVNIAFDDSTLSIQLAVVLAIRTPEEIAALKRSWEYDPIWDIEGTPGFEYYYKDLALYRNEREAFWKGQAARKVAERAKASFSMQGALDDLRASSERIAQRELRSDFDDAVEVEQVVLAQLQIRAILLAARQLERIADELEGGNDLAFSTALYAVEGEE